MLTKKQRSERRSGTSALLPAIVVAGVLLSGCRDDARDDAKGAGTGGSGSGGNTGVGGAGTGGGQPIGGQAGPGGQGGQPAATDDVVTIMASYKSWQALSTVPVDISEQISSLCRMPTAAETEFAGSVHGRHALRDWANSEAATRITSGGSATFPIGAAIVKEKFVTNPADGQLVLAALGIMIKRAPGFDSAGGDWEFVYWNEAAGTTRGRQQLPNCTSCHASADATDFVFLDDTWRTTSAH